jgi:hypothetical protein
MGYSFWEDAVANRRPLPVIIHLQSFENYVIED